MNRTKPAVFFLLTAIIITIHFAFIRINYSDPLSALLLKKENFDTIIHGRSVELFTLKNEGGIAVQLTNYGGHLVSIITPDKDGNYADVLLGYDNIEEYLKHKMYQACIIGPFAYVISKGKFNIDGVEYQLQVNNGGNNLHSFPDGFDKEVFDAQQENNKVTLIAKIPHMKNGFPGNREVKVVYELLPDNTLRLELNMITDRKTICNLTNHAYFNLAGEGADNIMDHSIQIYADSFTPYSLRSIPTGEIVPVENTPFDLRKPTPIRKMIDSDNEQLKLGKGYDRNFVLSKKHGEYGIDARLTEPLSKRYLEVFSNQPGIQFYTGNYINGTVTGKSGKPYKYRCALCLEPQNFPDSPNQPNFPSCILEPGQVYYNVIDYKFGVEK